MLNLRTLAIGALTAGLGLSLTACSSLTRPDEITIAAEPLPSPNAPPKAPEPQIRGNQVGQEGVPGRAMPAQAGGG